MSKNHQHEFELPCKTNQYFVFGRISSVMDKLYVPKATVSVIYFYTCRFSTFQGYGIVFATSIKASENS